MGVGGGGVLFEAKRESQVRGGQCHSDQRECTSWTNRELNLKGDRPDREWVCYNKGRGEREEKREVYRRRGEAAVQRWEVFNWRVTLGARLVSSSPSIMHGQEMPEVMRPVIHSLRIPRSAEELNRHTPSITPAAPSSSQASHQDALTSAHLAIPLSAPLRHAAWWVFLFTD